MGWIDKITPFIPGASLVVDALSASSANKTNKKLAREQMAFQERMSSTEIQRRVQDMLAAGLNPMLAGANQQGASSAQGASTRVDPITRNTASSALAMQMQRAQLENVAAQTRLLQEQKSNVAADTDVKHNTAFQVNMASSKLEHETMAIAQDIKRKIIELDLTDQQLRQARLTNDQLEKMQPLIEAYQRLQNQAAKLGMTQREVDAQFAKELGEESKYVRFIQQFFGTPIQRGELP